MAVNISVKSGSGQSIQVTQPIQKQNITVSKPVLSANDKHYTHDQSSPSATWTINHNLSKRPSVTVVDSAYNVIICEVEYTSDNQVVLTMDSSTSGKAYLN